MGAGAVDSFFGETRQYFVRQDHCWLESVFRLTAGLAIGEHRGQLGAVVRRKIQQRRRQRFERRFVTAIRRVGASIGASARIVVRKSRIFST